MYVLYHLFPYIIILISVSHLINCTTLILWFNVHAQVILRRTLFLVAVYTVHNYCTHGHTRTRSEFNENLC